MDGDEGEEGEEWHLRRHCESTVLIEELHETFLTKANLTFKCYLLAQHGFLPLFPQPVNVIFFLNQSLSLCACEGSDWPDFIAH